MNSPSANNTTRGTLSRAPGVGSPARYADVEGIDGAIRSRRARGRAADNRDRPAPGQSENGLPVQARDLSGRPLLETGDGASALEAPLPTTAYSRISRTSPGKRSAAPER